VHRQSNVDQRDWKTHAAVVRGQRAVSERLDIDLGKVLRGEARDTPRSVEWNDTKRSIVAIGVAIGMKFIHSCNVIHRDLKPENVLLDNRFWPRVADFGLSKIMSLGSEQVTHAVTMTMNLGTPLYMAPELFDGADYTTSIDVYAFAMFLYELCTQAKPFREKGEMKRFSLAKYVTEGERPTIPDYVPENYRLLMQACWDHVPANRPTFHEIVDRMLEQDARHEYKFLFEGADVNEYEEYLDYVNHPDPAVR
jgi:serine/threonine protein kinase